MNAVAHRCAQKVERHEEEARLRCRSNIASEEAVLYSASLMLRL